MSEARSRAGVAHERYFSTSWLFGTWTNMPAALTEVFGSTLHRVRLDLTMYERIEFFVNVSVAGAGGAQLIPQVSLDDVAYVEPWFLSVFINAIGRQVVAADAIPPEYRGVVFLRLMGVQGNGALDPSFATWLAFK